MFYESISADDATVALMAKHILSGENFPVFFYRQTYMGSLNGFHMVPVLFVFGPSVLLVRLNAVAWSLLFPLGMYVLARRAFDEVTARLTLLLVALPPFLLTYFSTVAEPHFETNTFGVVLLLMALAVLSSSTEPRRIRGLACLGFVAGVAWWTSVQVLIVLGPILVLLLAQDPLVLVRRGGRLMGAAFVLGSLPAWLFYATQPDPGRDNLGSVRRFLVVGLDLSWAGISGFLGEMTPILVGTFYWEPSTSLRLAALVLCGAIYAAAVLLAGVEGVRARRGGVPARRGWALWLLLLTLLATFGALYVSGVNALGGGREHARYILPAYLPLLLFLGWAIARLARWSRPAAVAVLLFVLGFNLWTNLAFLWPLQPIERAQRRTVIAAREALARHLRARPDDVLLVDDPGASLRWQFLLTRPVVSAFASEVYYPSAVQADAAGRVALLTTLSDGSHGGVPAQLGTLGATATETRFGEAHLFEDIRLPARAYRLVPRAGWRVPGEPPAPPAVADGDLGTAWPARLPGPFDARELVLDLGTTRALARVVLWPAAPTQEIVPLEIAGSLDAIGWRRLGVMPENPGQPAFTATGRLLFRPRNGWLELVTVPQPTRYLRIHPLDPSLMGVGMVGEVFAYEAHDGPVRETPDLGVLVQRMHDRRVTRLLADPVVSARVTQATRGLVETMPANGVLNSHGLSPPLRLYARLQLRETDAALVPAEDAEELRERFASTGVAFEAESIGDRVLFQPAGVPPVSAPCLGTGWRVTGEMLDGQQIRYVVEARLRKPMRIDGIRLRHPRVSSRDTEIVGVAVSEDGTTWRSVDGARPVLEWGWAGRTLFTLSGRVSEVAAGGATGRAVRVELRLPDPGEGAITSLCARGRPLRG